MGSAELPATLLHAQLPAPCPPPSQHPHPVCCRAVQRAQRRPLCTRAMFGGGGEASGAVAVAGLAWWRRWRVVPRLDSCPPHTACLASHFHHRHNNRSLHLQAQGGGGNPFANMGNFMENIKKAQQMVQVEAAKVQEELAR